MANRIVKDSGLPIFVKSIPVPEATLANQFVSVGAIAGLANDKPYKGEDTGLFYVAVDTAALVLIENAAGTFTDKAPVYVTPGGAISATATGNIAIGYADRPKTAAAAGFLWVQLVPKAV